MPVQSRAAATRQRIIDAAVDLFTDHGYAETGLTEITSRANVTTGAFYYHFESKESLATTLITEGWPKALTVIDQCLDAPAPGLENVIVMTFALTDLMKRDKSVWIANHLNQAFGQLSEKGRQGFQQRATAFADRMAGKLADADLRSDISPGQVGQQVWMMLHGCHLLSDAMMDSVVDRLVQSWPVLLRGITPDDSLPYFEQFVKRTATSYESTPDFANRGQGAQSLGA